MFTKIPRSKLEVSEPNPSWFDNPSNEANPKWTNGNWLKSRFHFSFAEYNNRANTGFGVLRVLNDDLVQPNRGFSGHPHRDMEVCTYVLDGKLSHKGWNPKVFKVLLECTLECMVYNFGHYSSLATDSIGTEETLGRGAMQFMVSSILNGSCFCEASACHKLSSRTLSSTTLHAAYYYIHKYD